MTGLKCFAAAVAALVVSGAARAECYVCDDVVVLDREAASCFLQDFEAFSGQIAADKDGRAEFDLARCPDAEKPRGGLSLMPTIGGAASAEPERKMRYTLDATSAACLKDLLKDYDGPFDPDASFNLVEKCSQ